MVGARVGNDFSLCIGGNGGSELDHDKVRSIHELRGGVMLDIVGAGPQNLTSVQSIVES